MFEIEELRFITKVINQSFYLTPKTSFSYFLYRDVNHFEVMIDFDIYQWILETRKFYLMAYQEKEYGYDVTFIDQQLSISMIRMTKDISAYLTEGKYNIDGIAIHITPGRGMGFKSCEINNRWFEARYIDPYDKIKSISSNYLEPLHLNQLNMKANDIIRMFSLMAELEFDISPQTKTLLRNTTFTEDYRNTRKEDLFKILSKSDSHKYIELLDDIGVFKKCYSVINKMNDSHWQSGIKGLKLVEELLLKLDYFSDSVKRKVDRNLAYNFPCGLTKYQMLKFSVLFHQAYLSMELKYNSPELYENDFTSFCSLFGFVDETCNYYSQIIQNYRREDNKFSKEIIDQSKLYDFFEMFFSNSIDVLLVEYISLLVKSPQKETLYLERLEYFITSYITRFCEIQSINSEITTMEVDMSSFSDASMMILIDEVKKQVFLGDLRYDRLSILNFIKSRIIK